MFKPQITQSFSIESNAPHSIFTMIRGMDIFQMGLLKIRGQKGLLFCRFGLRGVRRCASTGRQTGRAWAATGGTLGVCMRLWPRSHCLTANPILVILIPNKYNLPMYGG